MTIGTKDQGVRHASVVDKIKIIVPEKGDSLQHVSACPSVAQIVVVHKSLCFMSIYVGYPLDQSLPALLK
jgi:hypothetical protein